MRRRTGSIAEASRGAARGLSVLVPGFLSFLFAESIARHATETSFQSLLLSLSLCLSENLKKGRRRNESRKKKKYGKRKHVQSLSNFDAPFRT
jgi:hypothetical protein